MRISQRIFSDSFQAHSSLSHSSLSSNAAAVSVVMSQPSLAASSSPPPPQSSSSSDDEDGGGESRRRGVCGGASRMSNLLSHADRLIDVAEHDVQVAKGYAAASGSTAPPNKDGQFNPAFRYG